MIVPISFQFSKQYGIARSKITELIPERWVSAYSRNPAALFDVGIGVRSTIVIGRSSSSPLIATTSTRRWPEEYRRFLFDTNQYVAIEIKERNAPWPRIGHTEVKILYDMLVANKKMITIAVKKDGPAVGYKQIALYHLSVYIDSPPAWKLEGQHIKQPGESLLSFESEEARDIAYVLLSGRLAYWWWMTNGDDFHLTRGILESFPIAPVEVGEIRAQLLMLAKRLRDEQPRHPSVTLYAGKEIGNYDMNKCRHITDQADQLILDILSIGDLWPTVLLADARAQKVTGERPGTRREWPFPWEWQGQLVQPDHWS